jgi:hypothetical protein
MTTASNNKLDIITRDNKQETCMSIDVALSADRNMNKKQAKKILIYKKLTIEIQRMWNVIAVATAATGTISKSLRHYPEQHTGKV